MGRDAPNAKPSEDLGLDVARACPPNALAEAYAAKTLAEGPSPSREKAAGPREAQPASASSPLLPYLLTAGEAATLLRTTRRAIYARAERGLLPGAVRDGRRLLILRDELLAYFQEKRAPSLFSNHLLPRLGPKRLDRITDEDVQDIKAALATRNRKTVNNVISLLHHTLRIALKWKVIAVMPCTIELYKVSDVAPKFYEVEEYERLVESAGKIDERTLVAILLGGDAGLRRGEIVALRQTDVDLRRRQLRIELSDWRGIVDTPKGGRGRIIPMTDALAAALTRIRHLRGERVLTLEDGSPVPGYILRDWVERAQRRAGLEATGNVHILRHTFCSHLAMRGAPAKAIQELAGHEHLTTTLRYMHLSPAAREGAIQLLNDRRSAGSFGDIVETGGADFLSHRHS